MNFTQQKNNTKPQKVYEIVEEKHFLTHFWGQDYTDTQIPKPKKKQMVLYEQNNTNQYPSWTQTQIHTDKILANWM